jgi:hypothetical protein
MMDKLQIPPETTLVVNIITLPSQVDIFASGTTSEFFTGKEEDNAEIKKLSDKLKFRVIKMDLPKNKAGLLWGNTWKDINIEGYRRFPILWTKLQKWAGYVGTSSTTTITWF